MITKGIVVDKSKDSSNKYKVRLPIIDSVENTRDFTPNDELSEAIICTLPGINNIVRKGDVVIVGFEDNDYSKPIILGQLFRDNSSTTIDLTLRTLEFGDIIDNRVCYANLPQNTTIGDVSSAELSYLKGVQANIQDQLNFLMQKLGYSTTSTQSNTINFTIDDSNNISKENLTWNDWVYTIYNTINLYIDNEGYIRDTNSKYLYLGDIKQTSNQVISSLSYELKD